MSATSVVENPGGLADAFDVFHAGIKRVLQESGNQRVGPEGSDVEGPEGAAPFTASADGLEISITVDDASGRMTRAHFDGDPSPAERAVLGQLCAFALGASPRELVEHGLAYVVERLRDPDLPRPVDGIMAPRNAGPCFQRPRNLVKALRETYISATGPFTGDNDFDRPYSDAWLAATAEAKHERLQALIQSYRDRTGLDQTAMAVFEIDQYDRVVVMFGDDVEVWDKPPHLLALERWLREETGERIEVFVEIAKDSNRLRRL